MINFAIIIFCVLLEFFARNFFDLKTSYNPGVAFGLVISSPGFTLWLSIIALIIIFVILFFTKKKFMRLGLSLMAGGALSNLLERIFLGYVIDWVPVPFFDLQYNFVL